MVLKRFLLFSFDAPDNRVGGITGPRGGWNDFKGSFDTVIEAMEATHNSTLQYDFHQVIDTVQPKEELGFSIALKADGRAPTKTKKPS